MRKVLCCVAGLSLLFTAASAHAGGYSIAPAQSYDGIAKAGADVATASGAEAVYYNVAGTAFVPDGWLVQTSANWIHLDSVKYRNDPRNTDPAYVNVAGDLRAIQNALNAGSRYNYYNGTVAPYLPANTQANASNPNATIPGFLNARLDHGYDADSREGNFFLPTFFLLSPDYAGFRFGFACVTPFGLAFRWGDDSPYAQIFNTKFALQMTEFNPTLTYKLTDQFSVGGGARMVLAQATIINKIAPGYQFGYVQQTQSSALGVQSANILAMVAADQYYNASTVEWGYNLGADYKPSKDWNLAVTYRSKIDLSYTGEQIINGSGYSYGTVSSSLAGTVFNGGERLFGPGAINRWYGGLIGIGATLLNRENPYASPTAVSRVQMDGLIDPALLNLSVAYTFDKTTVELTYLRTFWSALKTVTFSPTMSSGTNGVPTPPMSQSAHYPGPVTNAAIDGVAETLNIQGVKNWHDTSDVQLGLSHKATQKLTLMGGVGYGESPIPEQTMAFDLPDSDAWAFSIGAKYQLTKKLEVGFGALYQIRMNHSAYQGYNLQRTFTADGNSTVSSNPSNPANVNGVHVGGPVPTQLSAYPLPPPGSGLSQCSSSVAGCGTYQSTTADGQVNGDFQDMSGYMFALGLQYKF